MPSVKQEGAMFPSYSTQDLLALLTEHTSNYTQDGDMLPVRFDTSGTSRIDEEGKVYINPITAWNTKKQLDLTEEQAVRVMLNILSHEVEHYNSSELDAKKKFVNNYPSYGKVAGSITNILEDCYIDRQRTKRFKGLRKIHRWARKMRKDSLDPDKFSNKSDKAITVLASISDKQDLRNVHDLDNEFLQDWALKCEQELERVVDAHKQSERQQIAHRLTATLVDKLEDPEMEETDRLDKELEEEADKAKEQVNEFELDLEEELIDKHSDEEVTEAEEETSIEVEPEAEEHYCEDGTVCEITDAKEDCHVHSEDEPETEDTGSEEETEGIGSGEGTGSGKEGKSTMSLGEDEMPTPSEDGEDSQEIDIDRWEDINPQDDEEKYTGGGSAQTIGAGLSEAQQDGVELSEDVVEVLEEIGEDEDETRTVNRAKGKKVDINKVVRRKAGDKSENKIFTKEVDKETEGEETAVGVTLDASGSMRHGGLKQGLTAVGALGKATEKLEQEFTANTFWSVQNEPEDTSDPIEVGTTEITCVEDDFQMSDLDDIECKFLDPLALGVDKAATDLVDNADTENKLLFAVTDGNPTVLKDGNAYSGGTDEEIKTECREEVSEWRGKDVEIIGIAVGKSPNEDVMTEIFGAENWFRFEEDDLAEKLLTVYRNTVEG